MPRHHRVSPDGYPQHVLSRANDHKPLFPQDDDYSTFLSLMRRTAESVDIDLYSYCLMPTHFHFVVRCDQGVDLSAYMRLLLNRHVRLHHKNHGTTGRGHLYQGRYKNFVIGDTLHLQNVLRYVEGNAWRAGLVSKPEEWPWSSLSELASLPERPVLTPWPIERPTDWTECVSSSLPMYELNRIRAAVHRGRPYGPPEWEERGELADELRHTFNPRGRPPANGRIVVPCEL